MNSDACLREHSHKTGLHNDYVERWQDHDCQMQASCGPALFHGVRVDLAMLIRQCGLIHAVHKAMQLCTMCAE